jgi:hypothetical protein
MSSSSAADQEKIERDGYRWFFALGLVAIALSLALWTVDDVLSKSDSEQRLGQTIHELRTAQHTLPARVTDTRQTLPFMHNQHDAVSAESSEAHGH